MNEVTKLIDKNKLQEISKNILDEATRLGASQVEVSAAISKGFSVSVHNKDVETIEYHQDKTIDVTVFFGKRCGSASTSDLSPDAMRATVEAACHIAKFTDEDPAAGLADKNELAFHYPQIDLSAPWNISVDDAIALGCECERDALAYDKRIMRAEDIRIVTGETFGLYANSEGFMGSVPSTQHEISCVLIAKENEEMQRDYSYTVAVDPKTLMPVSLLAEQAAKRTVGRLGARRLSTMKSPAIYLAEEARSLLGHFAAAIQGGNLYRKASFLVNHLGKKIFPEFVQMTEHPHLAYGLGSSPFDANGVATRDNIFIQDGILTNYALSVYSARQLGMKTTGNAGGMHNLTIKTGNKDLAALLKTMDKGLLVTELMGQGVNLLTGDYSRGVGGFWVEHGEIQYPVHEITVAGKLQDIFSHLVEVGNDVDLRGNIRTGSLLLEEVMIAGE